MSEPCPLARIVLASASPRRLELLRSLGLQVEVRASGYHEPDVPGSRPIELSAIHAGEKLTGVLAAGVPAGVPVVAADTVVDLDGTALGKPRDGDEAAAMLRSLSGREHFVHTSYALAVGGRIEQRDTVTTRVRFYALTGGEIARYVATGEPLDKAGAYGIQGRAAALVESIDGDFYTVMGFPLGRFVRALQRMGYTLPA